MTPATSIEAVQRLLGYRFHQPRLLEEALTHKSYSNERRSKDRTQNERLEFLGDAVLSLVMSEYLAAEFPGSNEGGLSKLKAHLVSEASLAKAARRMKLGRLLRLGKGEELSKGREKHSLASASPDPLLFPADEFWGCLADQRRNAAAIAGYGPAQGDIQLRMALADYLHDRTIQATPAEILVTAGVTQGLALSAAALAAFASASSCPAVF